jgi:hypothetical protein
MAQRFPNQASRACSLWVASGSFGIAEQVSLTRQERIHDIVKRITFVAAVLGAGLFLAPAASAQGTIYISNLGQTPVGSGAVGSDSWIAQDFTTGTNAAGYVLNSVQLLMDPALGSPNGFTASIYSSPGNGAPGIELGTLSGSDPAAGGLFSYAASGLTLSPGTYYYVVLTAATPAAQGAYEWSAADSFGRITVAPGDPWTIPDGYFSSADGSSWTSHPRGNIFQFAVDGAAVPEPGISSLLALGGLWLLWCRRASFTHYCAKRGHQ